MRSGARARDSQPESGNQYKEEPLFTESKIVTSLYNTGFEGELNSDLAAKVKFDLSENDKIATIEKPNHTNILKSAIENSDAIIHGSETILIMNADEVRQIAAFIRLSSPVGKRADSAML